MTMVSSQNVAEGATCRANFGAAGRRRRTQIAWFGALAALGTLVLLVALGAGWPARLLVGLPAAVAIFSALEVRRNTCIVHAASGTVEGEDFRRKRVEEELAEASRRVAASIWRDGIVGAVAVAALAAATAFVT